MSECLHNQSIDGACVLGTSLAGEFTLRLAALALPIYSLLVAAARLATQTAVPYAGGAVPYGLPYCSPPYGAAWPPAGAAPYWSPYWLP